MKTALLLLAMMAAPAGAQVVPGAPNTDWDVAHNEFTLGVLREYHRVANDWRDALNERDATRALAFYSANPEILFSGRARQLGRDSVSAFLRSFVETLVEVRLGLSDFQASDKLAYASGPLLFAARDSAGAVHPHQGHHVTVLVREGRRWRIHSQVLHF